jgi:hypothetical protein
MDSMQTRLNEVIANQGAQTSYEMISRESGWTIDLNTIDELDQLFDWDSIPFDRHVVYRFESYFIVYSQNDEKLICQSEIMSQLV